MKAGCGRDEALTEGMITMVRKHACYQGEEAERKTHPVPELRKEEIG